MCSSGARRSWRSPSARPMDACGGGGRWLAWGQGRASLSGAAFEMDMWSGNGPENHRCGWTRLQPGDDALSSHRGRARIRLCQVSPTIAETSRQLVPWGAGSRDDRTCGGRRWWMEIDWCRRVPALGHGQFSSPRPRAAERAPPRTAPPAA